MTESAEKNFPAYSHLPEMIVIFDCQRGDGERLHLFHLDLAGTYAGNNQFGGVVQTSLTF